MRTFLPILCLPVLLTAVDANISRAQDTGVSFGGIRFEGNAGWDQYRSAFTQDEQFGYGAMAGFDGMIGRIVVGPEVSVWLPKSDAVNCATGVTGTFCSRSNYERGAALRAGYLVTPEILVFGKGGYVDDHQRDDFAATQTLYYADGMIIQPPASFRRRPDTSGYQIGGGAEYSLSDAFYVNAQFVYSRYDNHTSRRHAMIGVGVRFR